MPPQIPIRPAGSRRARTPREEPPARSIVENAQVAAATAPAKRDTRFDRRLSEILAHATDVIYEKGYEGASMRDLSRESGMSLAGLYYYFESKEQLLYLIQKHTFRTVIDRLQETLRDVTGAEERLRIFISNHLEYFLANMKAMKVLSHEADALKNSYGEEIQAIKREYYRIAFELVQELCRSKERLNSSFGAKSRRGDNEIRLAVLSLFGMMNWIYTWHNPQIDGDAPAIARRMADIFVRGALASDETAVENSVSQRQKVPKH